MEKFGEYGLTLDYSCGYPYLISNEHVIEAAEEAFAAWIQSLLAHFNEELKNRQGLVWEPKEKRVISNWTPTVLNPSVCYLLSKEEQALFRANCYFTQFMEDLPGYIGGLMLAVRIAQDFLSVVGIKYPTLFSHDGEVVRNDKTLLKRLQNDLTSNFWSIDRAIATSYLNDVADTLYEEILVTCIRFRELSSDPKACAYDKVTLEVTYTLFSKVLNELHLLSNRSKELMVFFNRGICAISPFAAAVDVRCIRAPSTTEEAQVTYLGKLEEDQEEFKLELPPNN